MKKQQGFTVIELIAVILLLGVLAGVFFVQKNNLETSNRDYQRKTAINAMYYDLIDVFKPTNGYYPSTLSADNLKAMDPDLLTDPSGVKLGEDGSEYHYEALNCDNTGKCKAFRLSADMEKESEYVKESPK